MKPPSRMPWALFIGALTLVTGCKSDMTSASVRLVTEPPLPVEVSNERIVIPEGVAIGLEIIGFDAEGEDVGKLRFEFASVVSSTTDSERFVIFGSAVGTYTLMLGPIDGAQVYPIEVEVVPQPDLEPE